MEKFTFFLCLLISSSTIVCGQQWVAQYNGGGNGMDEVKAMVADASGNVYVTGYALGSTSNNDYVTIKYNTNGVRQWVARYDGPGHNNDVPASIFVDGSGNVYVTGISNQLPGYYVNNDAATVKYSPKGVQLWVARYDNTALQREDAGTAVKADASGNVYVTGYSTVSNSAYSRKDYLTIKYNSSGVKQWSALYNGPANRDDYAVGLGLDDWGNIYVTGTSFAGRDKVQVNDYLTIKYNPSGVQLWTARYDGPVSRSDYATAIVVDKSGNAYVTGYSRGADLDYATIKYNTNGVQQWVARYDGPAHSGDLAFAIALDNAGNVYVAGTDQQFAYNGDYLTIKYSPAGTQLWTARYSGAPYDNDGANAIAVDGLGNVYVTGGINGASPTWDMATIKYNTSGVQQWVRIYKGPKDSADMGNAIALDAQGNVYVAGATTGVTSGYDFVTLKYTSTGARQNVQNDESLIVKQPVELLQNYPDPFSRSTKITFNIQSSKEEISSQQVKIIIYNAVGMQVSMPVNGEYRNGSYTIEVGADKLQPGIYYYQLVTGNTKQVKKMMVVK